jgi:hypothetical protein
MRKQEGYEHDCGHFNNLSMHETRSVIIKKTSKHSSLQANTHYHCINLLVTLFSPLTSKKLYSAAVSTETASIWNVQGM